MDARALVLYSRFATAMRRAGNSFDVMRFVNEDAFAGVVLGRAFESQDEELVVLALEVGSARKLLNGARAAALPSSPSGVIVPRGAAVPAPTKGAAAAPQRAEPEPEPDDAPRYVRSLR